MCWVWVGGGAGAPAGGRGEGAVQIVVVTLTHNQLTTLPHLRARDCVFTYAKVCSIVSMGYITYMQYSKLYTRIQNTHTYIHSHMTELHSCTRTLLRGENVESSKECISIENHRVRIQITFSKLIIINVCVYVGVSIQWVDTTNITLYNKAYI